MTEHIDPIETARNNVLAAVLALQQCTQTEVASMQLTLDAVAAALGDAFDTEAGHAMSVYRVITRLAATTQASTAQAEKHEHWAKWIVQRGPGFPDHACAECVPHSDILKPGFQCVYHEILAIRSTGDTGGAQLREEGSFYAVAKARGFADFGLTISGKYSDDKLQALREQYDVEGAGDTGGQS